MTYMCFENSIGGEVPVELGWEKLLLVWAYDSVFNDQSLIRN